MNSQALDRWYGLDNRSGLWLLAALIAGDILLVLLYFYAVSNPDISSEPFSPGRDGGYPEIFGYFKWLAIIILLTWTLKIRKETAYFSWVLVFTYILFDDALRLHERIGGVVSQNFTGTLPFGMGYQDLGELIVFGCAGVIVMSAVSLAYRYGSQTFRVVTHNLLFLFAAMVFFGAFVDMGHNAFTDENTNWKVMMLLGVFEDGGEMVVGSLMLWYVYLIFRRDDNFVPGLIEFVLSPFRKR